MGTYKDLTVYKKAYTLAMRIFDVSKKFPKEEKYSLTDQIRRSSRSVCINIAEAYRKRLYPAHFVSKCTDSDMENTETNGWLDFAFSCQYITPDEHKELVDANEEVGRLIYHMITHPESYMPKTK